MSWAKWGDSMMITTDQQTIEYKFVPDLDITTRSTLPVEPGANIANISTRSWGDDLKELQTEAIELNNRHNAVIADMHKLGRKIKLAKAMIGSEEL